MECIRAVNDEIFLFYIISIMMAACSSTIDSALTETRKLIALSYDIGYYRSDPDLCTMR